MFNGLFLSVAVRYEKYIYSVEEDGSPANCPDNSLRDFIRRQGVFVEQTAGDDEGWLEDNQIACGTMFEINGTLYETVEDATIHMEHLFCVVVGKTHRLKLKLTEDLKLAIHEYAY